jgi:uncharacterized LabA/DUF88 family protein
MIRTAILIDGPFFLKRFRYIYPDQSNDSFRIARTMHRLALEHLNTWEKNRYGKPEKVRVAELFRIYLYDSQPLSNKVHLPISKTALDFSNTETSKFRHQFHDEVGKLRKVELRMGKLDQAGSRWVLRSRLQADLVSGRIAPSDLTDDDFSYVFQPKELEMNMGLDIATLAYKKQVDQIVLISGDDSFIPAANLARREGIDFILDPMWYRISPSVNRFIDGLRSTSRNPERREQFSDSDEAPEQAEQEAEQS